MAAPKPAPKPAPAKVNLTPIKRGPSAAQLAAAAAKKSSSAPKRVASTPKPAAKPTGGSSRTSARRSSNSGGGGGGGVVIGLARSNNVSEDPEAPKRNVQLDRYIAMAREALGDRKYDAAKGYAVLAGMQNNREKGAFDADMKALYDEATQIAEELLSEAERAAGKKHYIAANKKFSDVASQFVYVELGKQAKDREAEIKKEMGSESYSDILQREAEDVFGEIMSFMSSTWVKNKAGVEDGASVKAVDIVRAMSESERKLMGDKMEEFMSLYGNTEYGQKVRKLRSDLMVANVKLY